jgi:cytochrome b561
VGFAAIVVSAAAGIWVFVNPPAGAPPPPSSVQSRDDGEGALPVEDTLEERAGVGSANDNHATPSASGEPRAWIVARGASNIAFTGEHAGVPFEGSFSSWRADIRFDPANLAQSSATVTIETASAADGVPLHNQSLPGAEWFDAANHPTATFRTNSLRARGDGAYEARGTLTIKGRAIETRLPFTLRIDGDRAVMDGTATIDRREADLGMESDPDAEYVSREIGVRVHVEAMRAR